MHHFFTTSVIRATKLLSLFLKEINFLSKTCYHIKFLKWKSNVHSCLCQRCKKISKLILPLLKIRWKNFKKLENFNKKITKVLVEKTKFRKIEGILLYLLPITSQKLKRSPTQLLILDFLVFWNDCINLWRRKSCVFFNQVITHVWLDSTKISV